MAKDKKETKKEEGAEDTNAPSAIAHAMQYRWAAVAGHLAGEDGQLALQGAARFYQETGAMQYEEIGILLGEAQRGVSKGYIGNPVIQQAMQMYAEKFAKNYKGLTCGEALFVTNSLGAPVTKTIEEALKPYEGTKVEDIKDSRVKSVMDQYLAIALTVEGPHSLKRDAIVAGLERKLAEEPKKDDHKDHDKGDHNYDNTGDEHEDKGKKDDKGGDKPKRDHKGGKGKKH